MSDDYIRQVGTIEGQKKLYEQINSILGIEGLSISDFPNMIQLVEMNSIDNDISREQVINTGQTYYAKLNENQKEFVDIVLNTVDNKNENTSKYYYIDGPGGSGKTFLYVTLWYILKGKNINVSTMAFTGIAAVLLPEGRTVHKIFGLPVPLFSDSTSNIKLQSKEAKNLKETDVFIWDEAPMAPRYALEVMDITLRDIMNNNLPFGGKMVILGGDFRQLLPIKMHSTRSEIVNLPIKFSVLWRKFIKHSLTQNMRTEPQEVEFSKFLIDLGDGRLNEINDDVTIPHRCLANNDDDIVQDTFGNLIRPKQFKEAAKCAILSARNVDVDEINERVVKLLGIESEKVYTSVDDTERCDGNEEFSETLLPEYLNTLNPPSLPPHELRLRENTVIMLIRNLSIYTKDFVTVPD